MSALGSIKLRRLGVLDIGSNSVRFVIYELFGAAFTPVYNEKVLAGLGRDLRQTGRLSPAGKRQAFAAIKRFKLIATAQNISRVLVGATAALRDAEDAEEFIDEVYRATGLDIHPVSGKQEARLTALGVIAAMPTAKGIAADLGGASLELIEVGNKQAQGGRTYPLGPFKILGSNLKDANAFDATRLRAHITDTLEATDDLPRGHTLYLIGGAWRNLIWIYQRQTRYPLRTLQAFELSPETAQKHARWAYGAGRAKVMAWKGINERRAETLPYGALLLDILIERLAPDKIIVSTTGLREGLIYNHMSPRLKARNALFDGCRDLARGNLQGLHFADPLWNFLKEAAQNFPHCFDRENENRLRKAACFLAGMGKGLHPDYQADLVFEDVLYAPLAGLTHKERAYLSLMLYASFTQSETMPNAEAINYLLTADEQNAARCYGAAIRLAVVASGRSHQLLGAFKLAFTKTGLVLSIDPAAQDLVTSRVRLRLRKLSVHAGTSYAIEGETTA